MGIWGHIKALVYISIIWGRSWERRPLPERLDVLPSFTVHKSSSNEQWSPVFNALQCSADNFRITVTLHKCTKKAKHSWRIGWAGGEIGSAIVQWSRMLLNQRQVMTSKYQLLRKASWTAEAMNQPCPRMMVELHLLQVKARPRFATSNSSDDLQILGKKDARWQEPSAVSFCNNLVPVHRCSRKPFVCNINCQNTNLSLH